MLKLALHLSSTQIIILVITLLSAIIPITAFMVSKNFRSNSSASEILDKGPVTKAPSDLEATLSGKLLQSKTSSSTPAPSVESDSIAQLISPTLDFAVKLEGRPDNKHSAKLFVGIAPDTTAEKPDYLLTFSVEVPDSGAYKGLNLTGLTINTRYKAFIKGPAQIATSSAFTVTPATATLNPTGEAIMLTTGDLNEDNIINSLDLGIGQKALGSSSGGANWNANADFNLDGIVNNFDLAIIKRHLGNTGISGPWYSSVSTSSGQLKPDGGMLQKPSQGSELIETSNPPGMWVWFPRP